MGKGDRPRPVDKEKYDANFEQVFGGGDKEDGGQSGGVPKEPSGRTDSEAPVVVEEEKLCSRRRGPLHYTEEPCRHCGSTDYTPGGGYYDCCGGQS
ncbi:hypothetical protein LCGC14_0455190 [marine sediment metagenome]|uniref:Uncharacterized protein n=1 Tax=marine sediment metagenome TaxID=412755 RepID=A0A0F9SGP3_9ZZZZ